MSHDDRLLIAECLRGRQAAWDTLIERYGRLIYSIPRRYGMTEADADDVFQSVATILFRKLDSLREVDRLSSWLITTTHRECWRIGRQASSASIIDQQIVDVGSPSEEQVMAWERQQLVHESLSELGGQCEELLRALFLQPAEPDYESVAEQLGMRVGSIGPTRARCFRKLERILVARGFNAAEVSITGVQEN